MYEETYRKTIKNDSFLSTEREQVDTKMHLIECALLACLVPQRNVSQKVKDDDKDHQSFIQITADEFLAILLLPLFLFRQ